jgi:hypothetical protein
VAYLIEFSELTAGRYLAALDLSADGRAALERVIDDLRESGDVYRADPERRLAPESDCFRLNWVFRDRPNRTVHSLLLVVSDAGARYGVLRVVYAEDFAARLPDSGGPAAPPGAH